MECDFDSKFAICARVLLRRPTGHVCSEQRKGGFDLLTVDYILGFTWYFNIWKHITATLGKDSQQYYILSARIYLTHLVAVWVVVCLSGTFTLMLCKTIGSQVFRLFDKGLVVHADVGVAYSANVTKTTIHDGTPGNDNLGDEPKR